MPPKKNKITKKATNGSIKKKNNDGKTPVKKKQQKDKEFVQVPNVNEQDIDISDEDLAFFEENQDFGNFLQSMNSKELARKVSKANAPKKANISKAEKLESVPEPMELSSSEDEDYDDEMITQDTNELIDSEDEGEFLRDLSSDSESEAQQQQQQQQLSTKRKNKKNLSKKNESDDEMDYEMKPRKVANEWSKKDFVNKLPIKLASGKITEQEHIEEEDEDEDDDESIDNEEEEKYEKKMNQKNNNDDETSKLAYSEDESAIDESNLTKKQLIILKKEELASLATSIQEDPEENIGRLKGFRDMYKTDNATVRKLALLAQLAVYKDIIPGYRIRLSTEKEESVLVSKDIRKLRQYEKILLHNYEAYLKDLNALLSKRNTEIDKSMAIVATKCLCELLTSKPHFNFRLEIMVSIVARMSTYKWDEMAELSYNAIINILEGDESGRISLDAVIMITRMIKSKHYTVNEKVITIFLHLRLKDEMAPISNNDNNKDDNPLQRKRKAKDKPFLNKKAKKALKETKEIEKEFQEAEAIVSKEEKDKHHTETLKLLFAFYFRVLKQYTTSPLLPNVLEGLARFSHLINVDFFNDLLNALRNVMQQLNNTTNDFTAYATTNTRKCLLCIITAFQLLSGQGEAVNYDLKEFYKEIYQILLQATFHTRLEDDWVLSTNNNNEQQQQTVTVSSESESELILRGLEMMFLRKRQIPIDRLAAFVKRFSLVALNMPTKTVSSCLNLVQRLINKDHRLDALIQSEDRASTGLYMPLLQDPELSNPFGTSLYELFLYQNHYDPTIRALAQTLQQQPSTN